MVYLVNLQCIYATSILLNVFKWNKLLMFYDGIFYRFLDICYKYIDLIVHTTLIYVVWIEESLFIVDI